MHSEEGLVGARELGHSRHDVGIETGGLKVFPRIVAAEEEGAPSLTDVVSGIEGLDSLLGGGLSTGSSVQPCDAATALNSFALSDRVT